MRRLATLLCALAFMPACSDADGDGWGKHDCDDGDPASFPGAEEVCDGRDNDCDGYVDEGVSLVVYWDRDLDGWGDADNVRRVCEMPIDGTLVPGDCDDLQALVFPGAEEICDELDNNCDGEIDEGLLLTLFLDQDFDEHGVPDATVLACEAGPGAAEVADDCDDTDPFTYEGADERCDGVDNDCDGFIDEGADFVRLWLDDDGDGFGDSDKPTVGCGPSDGVADNPDDCDDTDGAVHPDAVEIHDNLIDEDCDGWLSELSIPDDVPTLEDALVDPTPGQVIQFGSGTFVIQADIRGYDIVLAGEGCGRTTLYADSAGTVVTMDRGVLTELTVAGGYAHQDAPSEGRGGGVRVEGDATLSNVCVLSNGAARDGGGVYISAGTATLVGVRLEGNTAERGGGLALATDASLVLRRGQVLSNLASSHGGGLHLQGSAQIEATVLSDNAARYAGALQVLDTGQGDSPNVQITQATFHANEATTKASVAQVQTGASLRIHNSLLTGHPAAGSQRALIHTDIYSTLSMEHVATYDNAGAETTDGWLLGIDRLDPRYQSPGDDLRLGDDSPYLDAGDPTVLDRDGSASDLGAYGGPEAPGDWRWTHSLDDDSDGLANGWEHRTGHNPWVADAGLDYDADGLDGTAERAADTLPLQPDTDGDGVIDGADAAPTDPRDNRPLALVTGQRWVAVGDAVSLDGGGSADPNGDTLSFRWALAPPIGSALVDVDDPTGPVAQFTPDVGGTYQLTLTVDDGAASNQRQVQVLAVRDHIVPDDHATLAEAVDAAGDYDTVGLRAGTYEAGLELAGKSITLVGLDAPTRVLLDAGARGSVIHAEDGEELVLASLTLQGGSADEGGGLHLDGGSAQLSDVHIRDNVARLAGGGIWATGGASLVVLDSLIEGNFAAERGGGVATDNASVLVLRRTRLDQNTAWSGGGGLYFKNGNEPAIDNVVFTSNEAPEGAAVWRYSASTLGSPIRHSVLLAQRGAPSAVHSERGVAELSSTIVADPATTYLYSAGTSGRVEALFGRHDGLSGPAYPDGTPVGDGTTEGPPGFAAWLNDGELDDSFALLPTSELWDAGFPWGVDLDGTAADTGVTGGPHADPAGLLFRFDADGDGLSDGWERHHGLDTSVDDSALDSDGDGLDNATEYGLGTSPTRADTDRDGLSDGEEAGGAGDPLDGSDHRPQASVSSSTGWVDQLLTLDGGTSSDPDGDPLSYSWRVVSVPAGSSIGDSDLVPDGATVSLTPDARGYLVLELTVSDGSSSSSPARVVVPVNGDLNVPDVYATIDDAMVELISGDAIVLAAGTYQATVDSEGRDYTLRGAGSDSTTLSGDRAQPAVNASSGEVVRVESLALIDGFAQRGGAAKCSGASMSFSSVRFANNLAQYGGAIHGQDCAITLYNSLFEDNGAASSGGAIYLSGTGGSSDLQVSTTTFARNAAYTSGGAVYLTDGTGSTLATLEGAVFAFNEAGLTGGAIYTTSGMLDLGFSTFAANGGIAVVSTSPSTTADVHHSTFQDSDATWALALQGGSKATESYNNYYSVDAGGSSTGGSATDLAVDSDFADYDSADDSLFDLRLSWHSALIDAGGSSWTDPDGSDADIGAYAGPNAPAGYDSWYEDADADGMADAWETAHGLDPATDDSADDDDGDGLDNLSEYTLGTDPGDSDTDGDGVDDGAEYGLTDPTDATDYAPTARAGTDRTTTVGATATLDGSTSSDPNGDSLSYSWSLADVPGSSALTTADVDDAGTASPSLQPDAPGRYDLELVVSDGALSSTVDTASVWVAGDLSVPTDYATIAEALDAYMSGTIHLDSGTFTPDELVIDSQTVTLSGDGVGLTILDGEDSHRLFIVQGSSAGLTLKNMTVQGGYATWGGALDVDGDLSLDEVSLQDNQAINGGAIYLSGGALTVRDSHIVDNTAGQYGGAIFLSNPGVVSLSGVVVAGNSAWSNGGAFYAVDLGSATLSDTVLHGNEALYGGGLHLTGRSGAVLDLDHVTATVNEASYNGAVLRVHGVTLRITDSIVAGNIGSQSVMYSASGDGLTASSSLFTDNPLGEPISLQKHYANFTETLCGSTYDLLVSGRFDRDCDGSLDTALDYTPDFDSVDFDDEWTDDDWSIGSSSDADADWGALGQQSCVGSGC